MEAERATKSGPGRVTGAPGSSRWNPTKEQINLLESLYMQGVRTPSADQIQQITSRLRVFGHIEGKNVFYWFQNHKARQRQKQKQETMAFYNRYLHHHHHQYPLNSFPQPYPCPNVVCGPYYIQQNDMGFYPPQHYQPSMLIPDNVVKNKSRRSEKVTVKENPTSYGGGSSSCARFEEVKDYSFRDSITTSTCCEDEEEKETLLPLFPIHPTGDLQVRRASNSAENSTTSGIEQASDSDHHHHPGYFDFFQGTSWLV